MFDKINFMERFVLDTNLFFNLEEVKNLGKKTSEVVENLTRLIKELKKTNKAEFYMPPSVVKEFLSFFQTKEAFVDRFLVLVNIKPPERDRVLVSGRVFYEFVKETRTRSYRGLKVAEEEIRKAAKEFLNKKIDSQREFEESIGPIIKKLRERYRNATRSSFLDSKADADLLLLSKELSASLVSTDEGVLFWAEQLGIKTVPARLLKERLESLLK